MLYEFVRQPATACVDLVLALWLAQRKAEKWTLMNLHPETRKELRQIIQQLKRLENRLLTRAGEFEGKADSGMQFMFPVTVAPALREAATSMRKTVDDIATARASLQAELNDRR